MRKYFSITGLFILFALNGGAQQPAWFLLGEEQFKGIQIYDVIQDRELNYWFATDEGIYKFDSYSFARIECPGTKGLSVFGFVKNDLGFVTK